MTVPNIPTDNLYKFFALTGVFVFLFFLVYPTHVSDEIELKISDNLTKVGLLEIDLEKSVEDLEGLRASIEKLGEKLRKLVPNKQTDESVSFKEIEEKIHDKSYREYIKFLAKYRAFILPEIDEHKKLTAEFKRLRQLNYEQKKISFEISRAREIIVSLLKKSKTTLCFFVVGQILGLGLAVYGFRMWYTKVQKVLDEKIILELKQLKS